LVGRAFRQHLVGMLKKYFSFLCIFCKQCKLKNGQRNPNSPEKTQSCLPKNGAVKATIDIEISEGSGSDAVSIKVIQTQVIN